MSLPRYQYPPIISVPCDDGTIALVVSPINRKFGYITPLGRWKDVIEVCRLEAYKGDPNVSCWLSLDGKRLVALGTDPSTLGTKDPKTVLRIWDVSAVCEEAAKKIPKLSQAERDDVWGILFKDHPDPETADVKFDFHRALQAMISLVYHGDEGVAWLRRKMGPPYDLDKVRRRIAEVDDPEFAKRENASKDLEQWGPLVRPFLQRALEANPSLEAERRLEKLLTKLEGTAVAYEFRQIRIIDVLEHINSPAARELLQQIADGRYDPAFANEAKQALQRAKRKP